MSHPVTRLNAALEGRYAIERELGRHGLPPGSTSIPERKQPRHGSSLHFSLHHLDHPGGRNRMVSPLPVLSFRDNMSSRLQGLARQSHVIKKLLTSPLCHAKAVVVSLCGPNAPFLTCTPTSALFRWGRSFGPSLLFLNSHYHAHGRRSWSTSAYSGPCPLAPKEDRLYVPLEQCGPSDAATFRLASVAHAPAANGRTPCTRDAKKNLAEGLVLRREVERWVTLATSRSR